MKRLVRKGTRVFLVVLTEVDGEPTAAVAGAAPTLDNSDQPTADQLARPAVQRAPGSESPWVAGMLSEFSDMFQNSLPVGLPPE